MHRGNIGYALAELGAYERAEAALRETLLMAAHIDHPVAASVARQNLARVLLRLGRVDEAIATARQAESDPSVLTAVRLRGAALTYLAEALAARGDDVEASRVVDRAVELLRDVPPSRPQVLAVRARLQLGRGDPAAALDDARLAMRGVEDGDIDEGEMAVRLVLVEALVATGRLAAAAEALAEAMRRLEERAARIRDESLRASFLEAVPEHARLRALASAHGVG
jgi:tetratricopeptide (TPR) repeat protein